MSNIMIFPDVSLYDDRRYDSVLDKFIYDQPMDWSKQVANGARFAFIKCSEYVEDLGFKVQWSAARRTNLILGAWHYFHPYISAITQAQMQIAILNKAGLNWTGDPKTSDKIQLDLEVMDSETPAFVMRAVASWYYEVNKAFPLFEKDIYVGWWFWENLLNYADGNWAKDTKLWLPAYPLDPHPNTVNPPPPFNVAQVKDLASKAFTTYAMKDLPPWGQPSYRQITAYADSRFVPGHPAIKKVVDINVLNPNYFKDAPVTPPTPPQPLYPAYITLNALNVRKEASQTSQMLGVMPANTTVYVNTPIPSVYSHFQPTQAFQSGGWIWTAYLKKV